MTKLIHILVATSAIATIAHASPSPMPVSVAGTGCQCPCPEPPPCTLACSQGLVCGTKLDRCSCPINTCVAPGTPAADIPDDACSAVFITRDPPPPSSSSSSPSGSKSNFMTPFSSSSSNTFTNGMVASPPPPTTTTTTTTTTVTAGSSTVSAPIATSQSKNGSMRLELASSITILSSSLLLFFSYFS